MKPNRMIVSGLVLGACLFSSACATQPDRGTAQNSFSQGPGGELDEVIGDRWLHSQVILDEVLTRRVEDRLQVQFNLRNTKSRNLPLEWAVVWFDGSGFELPSSRHWTPAVIGGKDFLSIQRTAPSADAAGFRLGLRKPNTVN